MKNKINYGFTLLELMVVIAVLAVLMGIAIPSFQTFIQNSRLESASESIYTILNAARQEAVASGQKGFVCRSSVNPVNEDDPQCNAAGGTSWDFGLISYRSLDSQVAPAPLTGFGNQRIDELEAAVETRKQMIIRSSDFKDRGINFVSNSSDLVIRFNGNGTFSNAAPFRIAVCDERGESNGRYVEINSVGRIFLRSTSADGTDTDCTPT